VTLPYTVENNDITMMIVQHTRRSTGRRNASTHSTDCMRKAPGGQNSWPSPSTPIISGQPFRIKYLEAVYAHIAQFSGVLHWNGEQILNWYVTRDKRGEQ